MLYEQFCADGVFVNQTCSERLHTVRERCVHTSWQTEQAAVLQPEMVVSKVLQRMHFSAPSRTHLAERSRVIVFCDNLPHTRLSGPYLLRQRGD